MSSVIVESELSNGRVGRVSLEREYVSGGQHDAPFVAEGLRSLARLVARDDSDDWLFPRGRRLWRAMLLDPTVSSAVETLKESALAENLRLTAATESRLARRRAVEH